MSFLSDFLRFLKSLSPLRTAAVVFGALLFFVVVFELSGPLSPHGKEADRLVFPAFLAAQASRIELRDPSSASSTLVLEKAGKRWRLVGPSPFSVGRGRIDAFLSLLENLTYGTLVSNNPGRATVFGLSGLEAFQVKVWGSRERLAAELWVGAQTEDRLFYAKKAGTDEVILVSSLFRPFLTAQAEAWRDKTLFSVEEKTLRSITLATPASTTTLERQDSLWRVTAPAGQTVDTLALRTLLEQLKDFTADRFADALQASQADFRTPDASLSLVFFDGSSQKVVFKKLDDGSAYYANPGGQSPILVVDAPKAENLIGLPLAAENSDSDGGSD